MRIICLAAAAAAAMLVSCTDYVSKDFKKFDEYEWNRTDIQQFTVDIPTDTLTADVVLHVRYATGFPYQNLNLVIEETAPGGQSRTAPFSYKLRGDDGAYLGDGSGDIWDISFPLKQKVRLSGGKYTYKIGHTMPQDKLVLIMELGITAQASTN